VHGSKVVLSIQKKVFICLCFQFIVKLNIVTIYLIIDNGGVLIKFVLYAICTLLMNVIMNIDMTLRGHEVFISRQL